MIITVTVYVFYGKWEEGFSISEDDYSPYSFAPLSKEEIGDTVMVILSGGMVLGSPAAGEEGAARGIK